MLFQAYHHHQWGGTLYLFSSDHDPTEEEVVRKVLTADFEPDKDEYLVIDRVNYPIVHIEREF